MVLGSDSESNLKSQTHLILRPLEISEQNMLTQYYKTAIRNNYIMIKSPITGQGLAQNLYFWQPRVRTDKFEKSALDQ